MSKSVRLVFALFLPLCVAGVSHAQNTNSVDIRGTVTDASKALLPEVTVTVRNDDTGVSKDFITNGEGIYDTVSTLPGNYTITFSKAGFEKVVHGPVALQVGTATVDAALNVGSTTQEVVVSSDVQAMHTENPEVANTFNTQALASLPNVTPSWQNFVDASRCIGHSQVQCWFIESRRGHVDQRNPPLLLQLPGRWRHGQAAAQREY